MPNHSIDAEQGLLGSILINNEAYRLVSGIVTHEHFFEPLHAKIFDVCSTLIEMDKRVTPVTIAPFLPIEMEVGTGVSLKQYLANLCAQSTTIINAPDYARVVRDYADMRSIHEVYVRMTDAQEPDPDRAAAESIDVLDGIIASRAVNRSAKGMSMSEAIVSGVDAAANAYKFEGVVNGLKTGLSDLDWKLGGLSPGQLIVLAGRPGMGKTGVALSVALNLGKTGEPGVIFSLEMDEVELSQRMISDMVFEMGVKVPYHVLRTGRFDEKKFYAVTSAARSMEKFPIRIETKARITLGELSARSRRLKRRGELKWLMIDYLQLMEGSKRYSGQRVQEISEITMGLKALAKELGVPVILLSQLSRDVEKREHKRPHLSDLRDSGSIEQDADVALMLYREEYYLQNREPRPGTPEHEMWQNDMQRANGKVEIGIAKNRGGPTGTVQLWCDIGCNAFRSLVEDNLPQQEALTF
jgi:replicative DNA helicase